MEPQQEGRPFSVYATKATTSRVQLLRWSPIHELIAVIFEDAPLTLYRLPWKRVWSSHTALQPTALCWSPDGRSLLVGYEDGSVQCLSKETGVVEFTVKVDMAGNTEDREIVCMDWTTRDVDGMTRPLDASHNRQNLVPEVTSSLSKRPTDAASVYREFDKLSATSTGPLPSAPPSSYHGTILSVGHRNGEVTLFLEANVAIAQVQTSAFVEGNVTEVELREVAMIKDGSALILMQFSHQGTNVLGSLKLMICDCREIGSNMESVSSVALKVSRMGSLLEDCEECLEQLRTTWLNMLKHYHAILNGPDISLEQLVDELTIFMGMHIVTENLKYFLEKRWTSIVLQRNAHVLDGALHNMTSLLNGRLRLQFQKVLVIVEELCSFAECQDILRETAFGLKVRNDLPTALPDAKNPQEKQLHEIRSRTMWLLLRLDQIHERLHAIGKGYRLFLCLLQFVRQVSQEENAKDTVLAQNTDLLLEFMHGELQQESLMTEFEALDARPSHFRTELKKRPSLHKIATEVVEKMRSEEESMGMRCLLGRIITSTKRCLQDLKKYLGGTIHCTSVITLCSFSVKFDVMTSLSCYGMGSETRQFSLVFNSQAGRLRSESQKIIIVRGMLKRSEQGHSPVLTPTAFSVPNDLKLIDHCLFRDSHVLALIEAKKTGLTDLVAIKMETVQQHSSDRMTCDPPTDLENFEKVCKSHFVTLNSVEKQKITHEYASVTRPLAVSDSGLAIVVSDQRIMVYHLGSRATGV